MVQNRYGAWCTLQPLLILISLIRYFHLWHYNTSSGRGAVVRLENICENICLEPGEFPLAVPYPPKVTTRSYPQ